MTDYSPPIEDIQFVLEHVAGLEGLLAADRFEGIDVETVSVVVAEVARFMAEVIAPTNQDGDQIGSQRNDDGEVITPPSFKPAYEQYVASGFGAVPFDPEYGGGGFPWIAAIAIQEVMCSANMALSLCPLLTQGAIEAVHAVSYTHLTLPTTPYV